MSKKYLYYFSEGNDAFGGDKVTMKNTLGGKGAGLAEMTAAGMPVPQGFTITTDACTQYYADGRQINDDITADIFEHLKGLEEITGKKFGDNTNPLLVSVRSGARQSMPGMMDTILNLGLNDQAVEGLAKKTNNPRFAYDCYRRFIQMYSDVVMELGKSFFEERIDAMKERKGVKQDVELDANDLKELVKEFKQIYLEKQGEEFPQDPKEQLIGAIIVGTGLPQISNEREILMDYYEKRMGEGFDYAYRYPGMNKVLQAAGRVIRTIDDVGVIELLDERFLQSDYRNLFPKEWEKRLVCTVDSVESYLEKFWEEKQ